MSLPSCCSSFFCFLLPPYNDSYAIPIQVRAQKGWDPHNPSLTFTTSVLTEGPTPYSACFRRRSSKITQVLNSLEGVCCTSIDGAMYAFPTISLPRKGEHAYLIKLLSRKVETLFDDLPLRLLHMPPPNSWQPLRRVSFKESNQTRCIVWNYWKKPVS